MQYLKAGSARWHLLTVLLLAALGWGLAVATQRMNYQWTWYSVPQYFIYRGPVDQFAEGNGEARIVLEGDGTARVTVRYPDGGQSSLTLAADSLTVADGDLVREGDKLGSRRVVRQGLLVQGLVVTLQLSALSGLLGLLIGLVSGLARIADNPTVRSLSTFYIEIIRGTPLLVHIFIFYFFIGTVLDLSRFTAGVLALALFAGAYVGEIVRAGIQSLDRGQMEAARSLGMNYLLAMVLIILPQALRRVLPALAGQFISLIKDSSLVSVIAITDLTKAGREVITNTFATFEIWFTVAAMYLLLTFTLSLFAKYLERRFAISG